MRKLRTRIIPILLLKNKGLYKGINFKKHKYIGDPINTVKLFNDKNVDELVIFDIEATKNNFIDFEFLEQITSEAFMPMGYGGGIKSIDEIRKLFSIGFEKIIINSVCYQDYNLIRIAADEYGSQSIVACVDVKRHFSKYCCYSNSGTKKEKIDLRSHIENLINAGIGELIISDIDKDGKMGGYNLDLIKKISSNLKIPLISSCGAGNLSDLKKAKESGAQACAAGSMFVYKGEQRGILINYPKYKDLFEILSEEI